MAKQIIDLFASMEESKDQRYVEALRVGKIMEEAGEAWQALLAYHKMNPRKESGPLSDLIKELADVAITAKTAIESFGVDSGSAIQVREYEVLQRLYEKVRSSKD